MKMHIQVVIDNDQGQTYLKELICLDKGTGTEDLVGLSLAESKQLLKQLQISIIQHQAKTYTEAHRCCPDCEKPRSIKGQSEIQYRTLFGIIPVPNQRLYHCQCAASTTQTFSVLNDWLSDLSLIHI